MGDLGSSDTATAAPVAGRQRHGSGLDGRFLTELDRQLERDESGVEHDQQQNHRRERKFGHQNHSAPEQGARAHQNVSPMPRLTAAGTPKIVPGVPSPESSLPSTCMPGTR